MLNQLLVADSIADLTLSILKRIGLIVAGVLSVGTFATVAGSTIAAFVIFVL